MSKGWFKFGELDTREYGFKVTGVDVFSALTKDQTVNSVPGRNGDILASYGGYSNEARTYSIQVSGKGHGFRSKWNEFARELTAMSGSYQQLVDSYEDDVVREAYLESGVTASAIGVDWYAGEFTVSFSCKPQRWIADTEIDLSLSPVVVGVVENEGSYPLDTWSVGRRTGFIPITGGKSCVIRTQPFATAHCSVHGYNASGTHKSYEAVDITADNGQYTFEVPSTVKKVRISWTTTSVSESTTLDIISQGKLVESVNQDGIVIHNTSGYDIYPVITLERTSAPMTSECYFYLGDYKFVVQPFSGSLVIDCENQTVYDSNGAYGEKYLCIYDVDGGYAYEYPHLPAGDTLLRTNNCTTLTEANDPYFTIGIKGMGRTV